MDTLEYYFQGAILVLEEKNKVILAPRVLVKGDDTLVYQNVMHVYSSTCTLKGKSSVLASHMFNLKLINKHCSVVYEQVRGCITIYHTQAAQPI